MINCGLVGLWIKARAVCRSTAFTLPEQRLVEVGVAVKGGASGLSGTAGLPARLTWLKPERVP